ncbi:MAG: hypothetical protein JO033_18495 [Acidobacteriaceae bacterium]|nr:hypothetical protein [Acidobacteriaceae bacterium]MBV9498461.1 hypothetical protein [Acidobacteriaceae bacterium]
MYIQGDPKPNDPTPLDKAKEIGQDLQKQGVTLTGNDGVNPLTANAAGRVRHDDV